MPQKKNMTTILMNAFKIALGSSLAIIAAHLLDLQYTAAAGSITLLTLMTTKWGTVRLSFYRLLTFVVTAVLACIIFPVLKSDWIAFGVLIFLVVVICERLGWPSAISVNAVIGAHFLETGECNAAFVWNECQLVLIGVGIAFVVNLFHDYRGQKKLLVENIAQVENRLQMILGELAAYLSNKDMQRNVWKDMEELENQILELIFAAHDYQDNTFQSHPGYYIDYFEMRLRQCSLLRNLHNEAKRMRALPVQARVVAEYVLYMADYVTERNLPDTQMRRLEEIFRDMKQEELPVSREEFENRALLYHMMMDLEDFLRIKKRFVEGLDEEQRRRYWEE